MTQKELREIALQVAKATSGDDVISFGFSGKTDVHMTESGFGAMFKEYQVAERYDAKFPYERYVMVDGVKFFCLSKEK